MSPTSSEIAERVKSLEGLVADCGRRLDGDDVTLIAVTKFHGPGVVKAAIDAGLVDLGENVASELAEKAKEFASPRWHFIGQLQTNKVRLVAGSVALYQSVDRPSLVKELTKRDPGAQVLIQVNLSEDVEAARGRGGASPTDVAALIEKARVGGLDVVGVMGVAPKPEPGVDSDSDAGRAFRLLRSIADKESLRHCSMGMSGDFRIAVAEGSTMIRVGGLLFGDRPNKG